MVVSGFGRAANPPPLNPDPFIQLRKSWFQPQEKSDEIIPEV